MTDIARMTHDERVRLIIGGNFSLDSLGPAYRQAIEAVRREPEAHLEAFERIFVSGPLSQAHIGELDPAALLAIVRPLLPDRVRQLAVATAAQLDSATRGRKAAFRKTTESDEANDIAFQRQLIDDRRADIRLMLEGGGQ